MRAVGVVVERGDVVDVVGDFFVPAAGDRFGDAKQVLDEIAVVAMLVDVRAAGTFAAVAERGAGVLSLDRDLNGDRLANIVAELAGDSSRLRSMAAAARKLAVPDAAERVARLCRAVARKGSVE